MDLNEINKLPKVELHVHLDGSVSLDTASKLSLLPINELKEKMIAKNKCFNLEEYLTKFSFPISLMQTKENLTLIAKNLVNNLMKQNVIYAEIRFAPMFHTEKGLTLEEVVDSVLEGLKSNSIKTNLILCLMRGMSDEKNLKTIEVAKKYLNKGVCALDLAGDEAKYPTSNYIRYFDIAKKESIPFTIHAGEASDAKEVEVAIKMGAKRIGHGIHSINDENVIKLIKDNNILLEICPTSNIQTNAIDTYKNHPIKILYKKGVEISINTDNTTVSNIDLNNEYLKLINNFNFNFSDFKKINIMAINHAFISQKEKENLINLIEKN